MDARYATRRPAVGLHSGYRLGTCRRGNRGRAAFSQQGRSIGSEVVLGLVIVRIAEMKLNACCLCLVAALTLPLSGAKEEEGKPVEKDLRLRMVSFNIRYLTTRDKGVNHWRKRHPRTAAAIVHFDADVVGVQEAFVSQLVDMDPVLKDYQRVGVGRDDGGEKGETCAILFRHERIEALDHGTFWLSDTPEVPGSKSWGNEVVRICTWAQLRDKPTGRSFHVFNSHFDHVSQPSREQAVRLIAKRIAERAESGAPFVLMGDLNAGEGNVAIRYLKGEKVELAGGEGPETAPVKLLDSFRVLHPDETKVRTAHRFAGLTEGGKIDYLLVPPDVKVEAAAIDRFQQDGLYPSDHFPVTATLVFPGR
jgi:endonuclease/exonuclease/phosphatase family metal-dependent hydrolase